MVSQSVLGLALAVVAVEDPKPFACDQPTDIIYRSRSELPLSAKAALDVEDGAASRNFGGVQVMTRNAGYVIACRRGDLISVTYEPREGATGVRYRLLKLDARGAWREVPLTG